MKTLAINSQHDLFRGPSGHLELKHDLAACVQLCTETTQVLLGELPFEQTKGIPFFDVALTDNPDLNAYAAYLRDSMVKVQGVISVDNIVFEQVDNQLRYLVSITTIYGKETFRV